MGGETVTESWFSSLWRASRKSIGSEPEKAVIGILAFEVASIMANVVSLWQCLSDRQFVRLKEEIVNSLGIGKLVSEDSDYLMDLAFTEIIENVGCVAKSVARFGKRCTDPVYLRLDHVFDDPNEVDVKWHGWEYKLKKMEKKVKKMERFVAVTAQLYQEVEVLAELEQNFRRLRGNVDIGQVKLFEFQQKVMRQRQEVKTLREMSPWVRTYDYIVRLLLRSLITVVKRIKHVFEINQVASVEENSNSEHINAADCLVRSHSMSTYSHASVNPPKGSLSSLHSGPLGRSVSNLGLGGSKIRSKKKQSQAHRQSLALHGNPSLLRSRGLAHVGPFKGCMTAGGESPILQSFMPTSTDSLRSANALSNDINKTKDCNLLPLSSNNVVHTKLSPFITKRKSLNAPPCTLGAAALALQYANVIILIEKLASAPHLISLDARDDLYNMLPTGIRASLREKLKFVAKTSTLSIYNTALAADWSLALASILGWLAPLAHSTIRWHSERNFEKHEFVVSGAGDAEVRLFNLSRLRGRGPDEYEISPSAVFQCHSRRVKKLAVEVGNPNVVWSASEDGTLRQHDFRETSSCPPAGSPHQECRNVLIDLRCGAKDSLADPPKKTLALKSCDISSTRPHLLLVGGSDAFARLYDRRMLPPLSSCWKKLPPPPCVNYFCPTHLSDRVSMLLL